MPAIADLDYKLYYGSLTLTDSSPRVRRGNQRANRRYVTRSGCHCREATVLPGKVEALIFPRKWEVYTFGALAITFRGRGRQRRARAHMKALARGTRR